MSPATDHDVIVIGAGHNGLTCAAYLARAGLDVLVLEARDRVGGCASTVEVLGGARANVCNCDHLLIRATGIVEELDLAAHGLRYLDMEPVHLALPWGGEAPWLFFADEQRTLQSLALVHPGEVDGYRRYLSDLLPAARLVLEMSRGAPTARGVARRLARLRGRGLAALLRISRMSCADVLRRYFRSEALLGAAATTGPAVWGLPPQAPGSGLGALGYALRHLVPVGRPVGGSGALTDALASAVRAAGGEVRTGARVVAIVCGPGRVAGGPACGGLADAARPAEGPRRRARGDDGRADGVRLADGTRLRARAVVSAIDPRTTLVELLHAPPAEARALVERWRARPRRDGYESKLDAVLDAPPRPLGVRPEHLAALGVDEPLHATMVVSPTLDAIAAAHATAARGDIADEPLFLSNVPSLLDPSVAPPGGGHVLSLETLFTPYRLNGGWPSTTEPQRWLDTFARLMEPGFLDSVRRWRLVGPEDYERDFSMPAGYAPSYAGGPFAALAGRDHELTRYATAVPGLFLTGGATFPGAGISGAPGRNAAEVVIKALTRS